MQHTIKRLAAAAAAVTTAATAAALITAGTAGAATGTRMYTKDSAGYAATGGQFRYIQGTVYGRAVAQYDSVMGSGFGHGVTLTSSKYTISLGVSIYPGDNGTNPWDAAFSVDNSDGSGHVGGCLAGNNGGTGGVTCNASVTGEPGAFHPGYITLDIYYNVNSGLVTFEAYQGSNTMHGSFEAGPGLSFSKASIGTTLADPSTVTPSGTQLLGSFSNVALTTYSGSRSGLSSWWEHHKVIATTDGSSKGKVVSYPSDLRNSGTGFSTYLTSS
ncbi:MAG: hypothetical protein J2P35_08305 [Actinobacteria bacterium]|nr:hypothetical protein [Actinomycetota bacterium]MBO0788102.1 hypothetical protein [Actinomycetota bacterium]